MKPTSTTRMKPPRYCFDRLCCFFLGHRRQVWEGTRTYLQSFSRGTNEWDACRRCGKPAGWQWNQWINISDILRTDNLPPPGGNHNIDNKEILKMKIQKL